MLVFIARTCRCGSAEAGNRSAFAGSCSAMTWSQSRRYRWMTRRHKAASSAIPIGRPSATFRLRKAVSSTPVTPSLVLMRKPAEPG